MKSPIRIDDEAYQLLKKFSETTGIPMSILLSFIILFFFNPVQALNYISAFIRRKRL